MDFRIHNIRTLDELKRADTFYRRIFQGLSDTDNPVYSLEQWQSRMSQGRALMVYAQKSQDLVGIAFGRLETDKHMIIGPLGVDEKHRGYGLARQMMSLLEASALRRGIETISLGALGQAEGFYYGLGYEATMLIQSQKHSLEDLMGLRHPYAIAFSKRYRGEVSQLGLKLDRMDHQLKEAYEKTFEGCHVMMMFQKVLRPLDLDLEGDK